MSVASLPPAAPVTLSAEVRLRYVLMHFRLAYPDCPDVRIGYAGTQSQVEVAEASGNFFAENKPYPAAPNWREWLGRPVPFFFDNAPATSLLLSQENRVLISADIIAAAFYLLSGWQEYFSTERDRHGRFPYAASVQKQYGFVTLPVVNYYFDVLKTAVEYVSGQRLHSRHWGGSQEADFAAFISHDIDNLHSAWKAPAKAALQQCKISLFSKLIWRHFTQPDTWDNLETVAAAVAQYDGRSTFFILPSHRPGPGGTPNADYRLTLKLRQRLGRLVEQGYELGLHASLATSNNSSKLRSEINRINLKVLGCRFHYLKWDPRLTPFINALQDFFSYDSTLGYAEHFGFRHSYCLPFYPFDFRNGYATEFLEIPLNVMDATLHHPNYLQLAPQEILPALTPLFAEIKRFGGVASVLWHNENFDPDNTQTGPQQFHEIMRHLQQQGAAFQTGREIWEEYTTEPTTPTPNS